MLQFALTLHDAFQIPRAHLTTWLSGAYNLVQPVFSKNNKNLNFGYSSRIALRILLLTLAIEPVDTLLHNKSLCKIAFIKIKAFIKDQSVCEFKVSNLDFFMVS